MQPERKIEKWLRGYAKRRRAAAGDSLSMPPATRRRLQEEVARRAQARASSRGTLPSFWTFFHQRWVFLAGSAFAILLGAVLLVPVWPSRKLETRSETTWKRPAPVASAPMSPPAAIPAPVVVAADNIAPPPYNVPVGTRIPLAGGTTNSELLTLALADKPMNPVIPAEKDYKLKQNETDLVAGVTFAGREQLPVLTSSFGGRAGGGGEAVRAVSGEHPGNSADAIQYQAVLTHSLQLGANPAFQLSSSKESGQSGFFQNMATAAKASVVLTRFKFIQNGNTIQIIDNDGSIYRGSWEPKVAQKTVNGAMMNANSQIAGQNVPVAAGLVQSQIGGDNSVQSASQVYSLRVSGDNRTLKQTLIFTGDLSVVLTANTLANNASSANGELQRANVKAVPQTGVTDNHVLRNGSMQPSVWLNSFIRGHAIVGGTNQVEVNAMSVGP